VLFCGVLLAAIDLAVTGPVLPALREAFDLAPRDAAWVFNVFVLCNLVGVPLTTRWADRLGRRTVFSAAVAGFGVGALVVAVAPTFDVVLVGRALQGAAASGIFPAASAMIGDTFPEERRGRALGVLGAVYGIAFLIGPALAGVLLGAATWRWVYLALLPVAVGVGIAAWRLLPPTGATESGPADRLGIACLGGTLAAFAVAVNGIDAARPLESLAAMETGGLLMAGALGAATFVWAERRAPDPLLRLGLFRNRQVVLAALLGVVAGVVEATFIFFSDLAVAAFSVDSSTASFMLLPLVAAVAIGSPVMGRLLDRIGSRAVILAGTTLQAAGLVAIVAWPASRAAFYGGSVLLGLGLAALLGSALSYILLSESKAEERTVVQGLNTLSLGVGQLLGGALIGAIAASSAGPAGGYGMAFTVVAVVAGTGVVLGAGLNGPAEPEDGAAPAPDGVGASPKTKPDPTPEPVGRPDSSHPESGTSEDHV
jgi:MFS family permease